MDHPRLSRVGGAFFRDVNGGARGPRVLRERATENHRTRVIRTHYVLASVDAEEKRRHVVSVDPESRGGLPPSMLLLLSVIEHAEQLRAAVRRSEPGELVAAMETLILS